MLHDYDKFMSKIPGTPAMIPNTFIGDADIGAELRKVFGAEKILSDELIQKIKSYSLSLRDFLTNVKTILLFVKIKEISLEEALRQQYAEEKEALGRTILKYLLQKEVSHLTDKEKTNAVDFGLAVFDKNGVFHLHPLVEVIKKSGGKQGAS